MPAVVFDVWLRPQDVCDLLLGTRSDGLVRLNLGDGKFIRAGDVPPGGVLVVGRHGESFG
jgi:hypothetical protein